MHGILHTTRRTDVGFTLLEMMLTLSILATMAAVAVPMMSNTDSVRVRAAADVLISDLEMAQVMNISYPNDPVVVCFNEGARKYWLAYADTPNTPLNRADTGEPYLVTLGTGRASAAANVSMCLTTVVDNKIAFNSQGGLSDFSATPVIGFSLNGTSKYITVAATTGTICEVDN